MKKADIHGEMYNCPKTNSETDYFKDDVDPDSIVKESYAFFEDESNTRGKGEINQKIIDFQLKRGLGKSTIKAMRIAA